MSTRYTAGLHNVGSYQVSGQPWVKNHSFAGVESKFYEFPNVTDHIKITNDIGAVGNDVNIVFCEPRRGLQLAPAGVNVSNNFQGGGLDLSDFTISLWIKMIDLEPTKFFELESSAGNPFRFQIHNTTSPQTRLFVDGNHTTETSLPFVAGEYYNIVGTFSSGNSNIYVNGQLHQSSAVTYTDKITNLILGSIATNGFDGVYEQVIIFDRALSEEEVASVYAADEIVKSLSSNLKDSIVSRYEFEDNTYKNFFAVSDTTTTIQDRVGNVNLTRSGSNTAFFVDGKKIEIALERHNITLVGQQEILLSCKSKQIFLRSTGNTEVNISAGLTGISAQHMYDLTGPGIDE